MADIGVILPCYNILKTSHFPRDLRLIHRNVLFEKFCFSLKGFRLCPFVYVLEETLFDEQNKWRKSLALYIYEDDPRSNANPSVISFTFGISKNGLNVYYDILSIL